jgi:hypothetical protein
MSVINFQRLFLNQYRIYIRTIFFMKHTLCIYLLLIKEKLEDIKVVCYAAVYQ